MQPIRGDIHVAVEYERPIQESTIRDLIEWYKKVVTAAADLGTPSAMELKYVHEAWVVYAQAVATTQRIPAGALMMFSQELARAETRAGDLAIAANE